jgi:hypothetical protein
VRDELASSLKSRRPVATDHPRVIAAAETWWGELGGSAGAQLRAALLPRLFLQHFADTSIVVEDAEGSRSRGCHGGVGLVR